jgi:hypothetical protein
MKDNFHHCFHCLAVLFFAVVASAASAATVTLDLNGFVSPGGSITGEGIADPIPIPSTEKIIKLENLQAGMTYRVDFFHNTGDDSSDFEFIMNKEGTGVGTVSLGGGRHTMVADFKPGTTELKLNTFDVTFNPDKAQTGGFNIPGMTRGRMDRNSEPVTAKLIPGKYSVENFGGPPGANIYEFIVDSRGKVGPSGSSDEYAAFVDSAVKPRVAKVHFKIVASGPIEYNTSHQIASATTAAPTATENINEFDMFVPVGGAGVTVTTFGPSRVELSNVVLPDGRPFQGTRGDEDVTFNPRLCFDSRRGFFFETMRGPMTAVMANVTGQLRDKQTELTAKFTATIVPKPAPTTRPTTPPPSATTGAPRSGPVSVPRTGAPGAPASVKP